MCVKNKYCAFRWYNLKVFTGFKYSLNRRKYCVHFTYSLCNDTGE